MPFGAVSGGGGDGERVGWRIGRLGDVRECGDFWARPQAQHRRVRAHPADFISNPSLNRSRACENLHCARAHPSGTLRGECLVRICAGKHKALVSAPVSAWLELARTLAKRSQARTRWAESHCHFAHDRMRAHVTYPTMHNREGGILGRPPSGLPDNLPDEFPEVREIWEIAARFACSYHAACFLELRKCSADRLCCCVISDRKRLAVSLRSIYQSTSLPSTLKYASVPLLTCHACPPPAEFLRPGHD